jgi:hypothetical protein
MLRATQLRRANQPGAIPAHARLVMTIPSNLGSTRFSSLAPTTPTQKPANSGSAGAAATQSTESKAQTRPALPAGLVGHTINTTA